MNRRERGTFLAFVALLSAAGATGEEADRVPNWTAPPFWAGREAAGSEEPADRTSGRSAEGRSALAAGPVALPFIALPPCRLVDTRGNGAPLTGGFLPPATVRSYTLTGVCGVPSNAQAISLNAAVVKPTGPGFLVLYPEGGTFPPVSTLNYLGNDVVVNAAVVPLSVSGGISLALGVSGGDVLLDTNGYYASADVASLNGFVGDVTLAAGSNITITPNAGTLTIAATPGGVTSVAGTNGISASPSAGAVTVTSNATPVNAGSAIVSRDVTGSFAAQNVTLSGRLSVPFTMAGLLAGFVAIGGEPFVHAFGTNNAFLGFQAGNGTMTGGANTAVGQLALSSNTTGHDNAVLGTNALTSNTTGVFNTAFGSDALRSNATGTQNSAFGWEALKATTTGGNSAFGSQALKSNVNGGENSAFGADALGANVGGNQNVAVGNIALANSTSDSQNTAVGSRALVSNNGGGHNTAVGAFALVSNISGGNNAAVGANALSSGSAGSNNIALGNNAGLFLNTGSNNIYIGAKGTSVESDALHIGTGQTATFIDGIFGQTSASGVAVFVNSSGKLGTTTSSRRYKEDIVDIAEESDVLMHLRPVAFVYKPEIDATRTPQYGLVAEEVAEVAPQLAVFDKDGRPETVRYHFVNAMLLNEVQKSRRLIDELQRRLEALEKRLSTVKETRPD